MRSLAILLLFTSIAHGQFDLIDSATIDFAPSGTDLTASVIGTGVTQLGAVTVGTWNASTVVIGYGGTGATTAAGARTNLDVDQAGTDNSTNVTLAGTPDYLTLAGQVITRNQIDLTTDVTGLLPSGNINSITESQISDLGTTAAMVADNLSVFAATTSAQLADVLDDETGTGLAVFATSPTLGDMTAEIITADRINLEKASNSPLEITQNASQASALIKLNESGGSDGALWKVSQTGQDWTRSDGDGGMHYKLFRTIQSTGTGATFFDQVVTTTGGSYTAIFTVTGVNTADASESAHYRIYATYQNVAGTLTETSETALVSPVEDDAAWNADLLPNSSVNLRARVQGNGETINWFGTLEVWETLP